MAADTTPKDNLKRLVIHVNGSDKNHNDHDYVPLVKQQKQLIYTIKIDESSVIHSCKHCNYQTMVHVLLKKHQKIHQAPKRKKKPCMEGNYGPKVPHGYVGCPQCTYYARNEASLKVHMRIHYNGTPYKCTECEFFGRDLKELIQHYAETKDLSCDVCVYTTHVKTEMMAHERRHNGDKIFLCGVCNYSSTDRSNLHRHLKSHDMESYISLNNKVIINDAKISSKKTET